MLNRTWALIAVHHIILSLMLALIGIRVLRQRQKNQRTTKNRTTNEYGIAKALSGQ